MTIECDNLSYSVLNTSILSDVNLVINPGEIVSLIGPNGSGKSTLINVLAGDIRPTRGVVFYGGLTIDSLSLEKRAKTRSVMSQSHEIMFDFSVREIIEMGLIEYGADPVNVLLTDPVMEVAECCYVAQFLDRKFRTLSGGEQRRAHLARSLLQIWKLSEHDNDRYLILDEPLSNLDLFHQYKIAELLSNLADNGIGILLVAHDLNIVANISSRVAILQQGSLLHDGKPREVLTEINLAQVFSLPLKVEHEPFRITYF
tara:strand:+ start:430 stop:1203 length:774 start_codon:yes stop_codon:yes gene_type:complete